MLSVTFCEAAVLKVMDQKTFVNRRRIDEVFFCQTRVYKSLIGNNLPDVISFSLHLWGSKTQSQTSKTIESTASISLAERWTIKEIRRHLNSVLTYSHLTDVFLFKQWFQVTSIHSAAQNESCCSIFSFFVHFQRLFGLILNLFGTYLQRTQYNYHCTTL